MTEAGFQSATIPGFPTPVSCPSPLPGPGACRSRKMADGECFAEAARAVGCPHAPAPGLGLGPPLGWKERLKAGLANSGSTLWFLAGLGLLYALRVPLRLCDNVTAGERPQTWTVGNKHQRAEILGESWRALEKESVLHAPVGYYYFYYFPLGPHQPGS